MEAESERLTLLQSWITKKLADGLPENVAVIGYYLPCKDLHHSVLALGDRLAQQWELLWHICNKGTAASFSQIRRNTATESITIRR